MSVNVGSIFFCFSPGHLKVIVEVVWGKENIWWTVLDIFEYIQMNVESEPILWSVSRWVAEDWERKAGLEGPILAPKPSTQVTLGISRCPLGISFLPSQMKGSQRLIPAVPFRPDLRRYRREKEFLRYKSVNRTHLLTFWGFKGCRFKIAKTHCLISCSDLQM